MTKQRSESDSSVCPRCEAPDCEAGVDTPPCVQRERASASAKPWIDEYEREDRIINAVAAVERADGISYADVQRLRALVRAELRCASPQHTATCGAENGDVCTCKPMRPVSSNASPGHTCDPDGGGIYDLRCAGCVAVRIAMVGPMLEIAPRTGSAQTRVAALEAVATAAEMMLAGPPSDNDTSDMADLRIALRRLEASPCARPTKTSGGGKESDSLRERASGATAFTTTTPARGPEEAGTSSAVSHNACAACSVCGATHNGDEDTPGVCCLC